MSDMKSLMCYVICPRAALLLMSANHLHFSVLISNQVFTSVVSTALHSKRFPCWVPCRLDSATLPDTSSSARYMGGGFPPNTSQSYSWSRDILGRRQREFP